jgi:hypothetical protein
MVLWLDVETSAPVIRMHASSQIVVNVRFVLEHAEKYNFAGLGLDIEKVIIPCFLFCYQKHPCKCKMHYARVQDMGMNLWSQNKKRPSNPSCAHGTPRLSGNVL